MSKRSFFNNNKNLELSKAIKLTSAPEAFNETSKETEIPDHKGRAPDVHITNIELYVKENQHQTLKSSSDSLKAQPRKWLMVNVDAESAQHLSSSECLGKLQGHHVPMQTR